MLARLGHRIKKELPPVRDGDVDHCRLWSPLRTDSCLDGPGLGAHEGQQLGWGEGVMMFDHRLIVPYGQPFEKSPGTGHPRFILWHRSATIPVSKLATAHALLSIFS